MPHRFALNGIEDDVGGHVTRLLPHIEYPAIANPVGPGALPYEWRLMDMPGQHDLRLVLLDPGSKLRIR